ncbi:MAG: hypothetical protein ACK452_03665 [Bacteroidota bacterium]|jgi:hypothetical protein
MKKLIIFTLIFVSCSNFYFCQGDQNLISFQLKEFSNTNGELSIVPPQADDSENKYYFMNKFFDQLFLNTVIDFSALATRLRLDQGTNFKLKITSTANVYNYKTNLSKKSFIRTISKDARGKFYYIFEILEKEMADNVFKFEIIYGGKVVASKNFELSMQYGE